MPNSEEVEIQDFTYENPEDVDPTYPEDIGCQ